MFTTGKRGLVALVATVATAAVLLWGPGYAEPADGEIPTVAVAYADLDLTSDAGVKTLYRRLQVAAKQVCNVYTGHEIWRAMDRRACYRQALSDAVAKINVEMLSVLHRNASAPPLVS